MPDPQIIIGLIFLPVGILFLILGIVIFRVFKKKQERASAITTATVVEIIRERSHSSSSTMVTYHPVYEYYANGQMQRVRSSVGSSPCPYQVGEQVELHFNPDKPREIFIEKDLRILWLIRILFCGIGGLFAILGAAFLFLSLGA